jgi:FtsZ-interacting cell division protein ZipA
MAVNIKRFSVIIVGSIALATLLFNSLPGNAREYDEDDSNVSSWYQRQAKYHQRQASQYEKQAQFDREMNEYDTDELDDKNNVRSQDDSSVDSSINDNSEMGSADVFKDNF